MVTRSNIVEVAKTYIGTPFHHLGRVKNIGIDCVGIILGVAEELNIVLIVHPEFKRYGKASKQRPLLEYMNEQFIKLERREVGSIAVSWYDIQTKNPSHLGIVTPIGMIHTNGHLKITIEEQWSPKWTTRTVGYYKYLGVK